MGLEEVLLEDKAIYMVFEYAEHDFLVHIQELALKQCAHKFCTDIPHLLPANHTSSSAHREKTNPRGCSEIIFVATIEWCGVSSCQLGTTS